MAEKKALAFYEGKDIDIETDRFGRTERVSLLRLFSIPVSEIDNTVIDTIFPDLSGKVSTEFTKKEIKTNIQYLLHFIRRCLGYALEEKTFKSETQIVRYKPDKGITDPNKALYWLDKTMKFLVTIGMKFEAMTFVLLFCMRRNDDPDFGKISGDALIDSLKMIGMDQEIKLYKKSRLVENCYIDLPTPLKIQLNLPNVSIVYGNIQKYSRVENGVCRAVFRLQKSPSLPEEFFQRNREKFFKNDLSKLDIDFLDNESKKIDQLQKMRWKISRSDAYDELISL